MSLSKEARTAFRKQSLDWLRTELAAMQQQLAGAPKVATAARQRLLLWTADPDLAGVRDADFLASLAEPERGDWQALWDSVRKLLEKAGQHPP